MAIDLTGKIKQAAKITTKCQLQNEAADALDKMAEAYKTEKGKDLVIKSGYVSPYDLIGELSGKAEWSAFADGESKVKKVTDAMASNGTLTEDDIKAALEALDGAEYDTAQFETLHAMQNSATSNLHPTLKDGWIFGWPNKPKNDPRRSGLVIVVPSDVDQINWMVANGYKYGWLYYTGPFDTYVYTNPANIKQDGWLAKASSSWGIQVVAAKMVMANNGRDSITQDEINNFTTQKQTTANNAVSTNFFGTKTYGDDYYRMNPDYFLWKWTWKEWKAER